MRNLFKAITITSALAFSALPFSDLHAADYVIDTKGAHAAINFKVKHLGYSWLTGRFNTFGGDFSFTEGKIAESKIQVKIDTTSVDSNHAERDKHLRGSDFLDVVKYPDASFISTGFKDKGNGQFSVTGNFTFHGVTKTITIDAKKIGEGKDPWGGYRAGFEGTASFKMADFGIKNILGPASADVMLELHVEGIRQ